MISHTLEHRRKIGDSLRGELNPSWKGENAAYRSIHSWVVRNWGKAYLCQVCDKNNACFEGYDWANLDHKYSRNRNDWMMMCRSCHLKHDYKEGLRKPKNYAR